MKEWHIELRKSGPWLVYTGVGATKFWCDADVQWLEKGNKPLKNADGFMILPFGHNCGSSLYDRIERQVMYPIGTTIEYEQNGTTKTGTVNDIKRIYEGESCEIAILIVNHTRVSQNKVIKIKG